MLMQGVWVHLSVRVCVLDSHSALGQLFQPRTPLMKKILIAAMACLALFSLTACDTIGKGKGKGKAPVTVSG